MRRITALALLGVLCSSTGQARQVGTNPGNDVQCLGGTPDQRTNEVCLEDDGDFVPTTTNNQDLGTSSLYWDNAYIKTLTLGSGGSAGPTAATTLTASGNTTLGDAGGDTFTINAGTVIVRNIVGALDISTSAATSGVTSILSLDGSNKRVGIGTRTPNSTLQVVGTTAVSTITVTGSLIIPVWVKADFDASTGNTIGAVRFCSDCINTYSLCVATGTGLSQFKVTYSSATLGTAVGCGTNN